ncbi:uncharacterized protein LOC126909705 [Daktulosphaira vitifoliae]|uniref:uncharacterized protein LOC126909705 n=1 Tax=Daktulosphaira vitifoliae TaxID=58002 RepID=UPI0021AB08BF|nr:uncharacterized protein LOC126909705 [Daktulosphaira vitifoliae]
MNEHNLDIEISSQDSKRKRLQPNSLKNFVVSTPTSDQYKSNENIKKISVEDHFRTSAFFPIIDAIVENLKKRFSQESLTMASSVDFFLNLNFKESYHFIDHYHVSYSY